MATKANYNDWTRARHALRAAVELLELPEPEIGRVRKLGQGLSRRAFCAEVEAGADGWPKLLVALVPYESAHVPAARDAPGEARLLTYIAAQDSCFRVPGIAVSVNDEEGAVLVCECLEGMPVDLRAGRMHDAPWELVGRVAAAVHQIPVDELGWLAGYATQREHGAALIEQLGVLDDASDREVPAALAWLRSNLPPAEPATLVHGDLLGHNLLLFPGLDPAVLDWECALRGDPAFDLAIVTRGVRRPFQVADGMAKLLEAHAHGSGTELRAERVRFHEICLHLEWYRLAIAGEPTAEPVASVLARLRSLLRVV